MKTLSLRKLLLLIPCSFVLVSGTAHADHDPTMDTRFQLNLRAAFSGTLEVKEEDFDLASFSFKEDAEPAIGAVLRIDKPVHRNVSLGVALGYESFKFPEA